MDKLIVEVRANEGAGRERNRNVPWSAREIASDAAACANAGASLIHYHCRTSDGGMDLTPEASARAMSEVRRSSRLLQMPSMANAAGATASERLANLASAADKPDFLAIEPGSANVDSFDPVDNVLLSKNRIFNNTFEDIELFLGAASDWGAMPYLASFNISWTRAALALVDIGWIKTPAPLLLVTGGPGFIAAHPGTPGGLDAHLSALPAESPFEWLVCCHGGSVLELAEIAISRGGHVSIGLGDQPYSELGSPTNAELVSRVVDMGRALGREPATPDDLRQVFGGEAR